MQKTVGLVDVLRDALAPLVKRMAVAFVFGSVARGTEQAASDVDVIVIGTVDFGEVTKALYPTQQALGREINPKVFSCAEWRTRLAAESTFLSDVMSKPKLFIEGTEDDAATDLSQWGLRPVPTARPERLTASDVAGEPAVHPQVLAGDVPAALA